MKNIVTIFLMCIGLPLFAQDVIHLKTGEEIKAKITLVGEDEIQYKEWDFLSGPDFRLSVTKIKFIRFESGREMTFEHSDLLIAPLDQKVMQKKDVVKFALFSPLYGRTIFGYEHVQRFGLHWEAELGIIGLGRENNGNAKGFWFCAGPKMLLRGETYMRGQRYLHYLHGSYVRPELLFEYHHGTYEAVNSSFGIPTVRYNLDYSCTAFGGLMNFGKQWFVGNFLTIDLYAGIGLASFNVNKENPPVSDLYTHYTVIRSRSMLTDRSGNGEVNLAVKGGFKFGFAF